MKYTFVLDQQVAFPVVTMCKVLGISTSAFYDWLKAPHSVRGSLSIRARGIAGVAHERGALVRIPAAVLAEVCRGSRRDAAINQLLKRDAIRVVELTRETAQRAGALLEKAGMPFRQAIDAFAVSTALEFNSAAIATGEVEDLRHLLGSVRQIVLMPI